VIGILAVMVDTASAQARESDQSKDDDRDRLSGNPHWRLVQGLLTPRRQGIYSLSMVSRP
jgi:hypothetical protein